MLLLLQGLWVSGPVKKLRGVQGAEEPERADSKGFVERAGGTTIFVFKFVRLDGVLALFGLFVFSAIRNGWALVDIASVLALVRDLCLSFRPTLK